MAASKNKPSTPPARARIGDRLRRDLESLVVRYVTRLRGDPLIPKAPSLPSPVLEANALSFLASLFQSLVVLENAHELDDADESELLADANKVQRVISELHGRQRYRLGWTEHA